MTQPLSSLGGLIIHVLRVVLFLDKEQRISRGEYCVGVASILTVGAIALSPHIYLVNLPNHGPDGSMIAIDNFLFVIALGILIADILFVTLGIVNLSVKRLHDMNKPGWWLFIPMVNIYTLMIMLFKPGTRGNNRFGDDPIHHIPSDDLAYWGVSLGLLLLSCVIVIASVLLLVPDEIIA